MVIYYSSQRKLIQLVNILKGFALLKNTEENLYKLCVYVLSRSVMSDSLRPPWTVAHQAPMSMGFSRQEHWSGKPLPSPGEQEKLNPGLLTAGGFFTIRATWEAQRVVLLSTPWTVAHQTPLSMEFSRQDYWNA